MRNNVLARKTIKQIKIFLIIYQKKFFPYILEDYEDNKIIDENRFELKDLHKRIHRISEDL